MPAPLAVDKEAVRVLVVAVGVREAAARLKLPVGTVAAWSARGDWLQGKAAIASAISGASSPEKAAIAATLPPSMRPVVPVTHATGAINAADALAQSLADDSKASRLSLSRGLRRVAAHVERMDPEEALEQAQNVKATVGSLATVHAWEAKQPAAQVMVSVQMLGMRPDELRIEGREVDSGA